MLDEKRNMQNFASPTHSQMKQRKANAMNALHKPLKVIMLFQMLQTCDTWIKYRHS